MLKILLYLTLSVTALLLSSCGTQESGRVVYSGGAPDSEASVEERGALPASDPFIRQRILADMLYEARIAYEDNRLMSPAGNNAYDKFREVLDIEPENTVAMQGIRDIVYRYVELADAAIQVGQFDNAESYLSRARRVGVEWDVIDKADRRLAQAREVKMDVFTLNAEALSDRSLDMMVLLGEIGQQIRDQEATFLINARTDEEGRWIYKVMREAVGGYRLRGNIAIDNDPSIQIVVPST